MVWVREDGYMEAQRNGKVVRWHRYVWELVNGPIPDGYEIHHKDRNLRNNEISNLELVTDSDHQRIHAGWIRDNSGKWISKPCRKCGILKPLSEFKNRGICKKCRNKELSIYREKNIEELKKKAKIRWITNREKYCAQKREYWKRNKDKINAKEREKRRLAAGMKLSEESDV